jgi:hypothetical protein
LDHLIFAFISIPIYLYGKKSWQLKFIYCAGRRKEKECHQPLILMDHNPGPEPVWTVLEEVLGLSYLDPLDQEKELR